MSLPPPYLRALAQSVADVYIEDGNLDVVPYAVYACLKLSLGGHSRVNFPRDYRLTASIENMVAAARTLFHDFPTALVREWWQHLVDLNVAEVLASDSTTCSESPAVVDSKPASPSDAASRPSSAQDTRDGISAVCANAVPHRDDAPFSSTSPFFDTSHLDLHHERNEDRDDEHWDIRRRLE
ncbi:hypothetical protein CPB85DRAFT_1253230 [Mucidula mucida]|nr:hypothetical protein CPB85DRAFT_1253230 [Mucidula mucida]